ncbi:MAG: choice-of-anchor D domain-containing protein [Ignavibacteriales bacterium]|nr:choice-of-anchor D domain-containing protein [Ignavibacteriales bacterium]
MRITDQIGGVFTKYWSFCRTRSCDNSREAILNIFSKAFLKMQYNCIGGYPNDPIFGISTQNLNFPLMIVGNDTTLPVTVTNIGLVDTLSITNIVSSNSHFTIAPNSVPIYLAPQDSQVFLVTNTAAVNAEEGTIQFTHNGCGSPTSMNVSAPAGIPPGPLFAMSTTSLIFRQDTVGTVDSLPVTIFNAGGVNTLYINYISSNNGNFSVYPNSFPIAIAPQSQQQFYVTYTSADTLQQGTIEIIHNAPGSPSVLNVSSVYNYAQFHMEPLGLYFNSQPMTKLVTIKNLGTSDSLIINGIVSSNSNFTVTPNSLPIFISPGMTKIFYVTLNNAPGVQIGIIEFFHNASGSPAELYVANQLLGPLSEGTIIVYSGNQHRTLLFGIDPTATDGIDQHLGEADLPPFPPPGVFESQLILPENNFAGTLSSYKDYRFGNIPISETIEYRITYQPDSNNGIEISWILPEEMTGVLLDLAGGVVINVPIADSGSFVVPNPSVFSSLKMLIEFEPEVPVELVSFTATLLNNKVHLNWSTATETNNSGFEIERASPLRSLPRRGWRSREQVGRRLVLFRGLELQQNQNHIHSLMKMLQLELTNTVSSKLILMDHSLTQTK